MTIKTLDDLFGSNGEDKTAHPRLRRWRKIHAEGRYEFKLEIHRDWDGLTYEPARMFVTLTAAGVDSPPEEMLWDDGLNQGLVELGVRASDKDTEVVRYALALRDAFEVIYVRSGLDYFRDALVEHLQGHPLSDDPTLKNALDKIHAYKTYPSRSSEQVREAVEGVVISKARELADKLRYTREESVEILARALAQYLSEIYHLRSLGKLG